MIAFSSLLDYRLHLKAVFLFFFLFLPAVNAQPLESVTLQLRWQHQFQFAGYYAALEKDFYKAAGLEVVLKEGDKHLNPTKEVIAGRAEFGVGVSSLILDYAKNTPVVLVTPIFQHSPNVLIAQGKNTSLKSLVAQNKTIALMDGDQDAELKAMFLATGEDISKLNIVTAKNYLDDFIQQKVDALYAYTSNEPYELQRLNIPFNIISPALYGIDFYGDALFTHQGLVKEKPAMVNAFRDASLRGWEYALEHPDEIIDLILAKYNTQNKSREHLSFEAQAFSELIKPNIIQIGYNNLGRWKYIAETYKQLGLIDSTPVLDKFFYDKEYKSNFIWLYRTLALFIIGWLLVFAIVFYIYRVNKRLNIALTAKCLSEEYYKVIFKSSASAGIIWTDKFIVTDWNDQAEQVFGWKREEVIGKSFMEFLIPDDEQEHLFEVFNKLIAQSEAPNGQNKNLHKDGKVITCEWLNAWLPQQPGKPREIVSLATDITERLRLEDEIRQMAFFDPLTHLPNRRLLQDRLTLTLANTQRNKVHSALMFLDLDNFKPLNDTHGHAIGDLLLIEVAQRLKACVRETDTLARLGGDEFIVLLDNLSNDPLQAEKDASRVAQKILAALTQPYELIQPDIETPIVHYCSTSIGVALFSQGVKQAAIFQAADAAMYRAKAAGKNQTVLVTLS